MRPPLADRSEHALLTSCSEEAVEVSGSPGGGRRVWWAIAAIAGTVGTSTAVGCARWRRPGAPGARSQWPASSQQGPSPFASLSKDQRELSKDHAKLRLKGSAKSKRTKWEDCAYEIMMLDTRSMPSAFDEDAYWGMTAVINHEYAKRFGYGFRMVRPKVNVSTLPYNVNWLKPMYIKHRLEQLALAGECAWVLYLDTDAFVREPDLPMPEFLRDLDARYRPVGTASAIFTQESSLTADFAVGEPPPGAGADGGRQTRHKFAETGYWSPWQHVNGGVLLLKADARGIELVDAWLRSGKHDYRARTKWPAEQGTLTELLFPGRYQTTLEPCPCHARVASHADLTGSFAVVNFTEMNGPWGRFVTHDWGGPGGERRVADFERELLRIGAADGDRFSELLREVNSSTVAWTPSAF